ncbi:hypothetical protein AVEN_124339-1 [Araneus ventricosus]|uniref:Tc1-like transposase DDE domain-containing protein n=2 Tax=Araneus ventricosus TaxID=182803 RepID=A0A4Y2WYW4_ARAVE|nr:hypothetical protein AVEN_124339-1 [Araneus ventricosus]
MTMFWEAKGVILIGFITSGSIDAAHYCDTLTKLKSTIQLKKPRLLSRWVLFLVDNATPSTTRDTKEHFRRLGWKRPGLQPRSCTIRLSLFFLASKLALSVHNFRSNEEVRYAVKNFLLSLGTKP